MGKIVLLDDLTINKIAAGEVIERPASVVKELVENSIDAGADKITVEIRNGGISYIRVTDNGKGFLPDDIEIAFERHATSKIREAKDLESVTSMGFRGEALASIAAISHVELVSKTAENEIGKKIELQGGNVVNIEDAGCPNGTTITVTDLFYNTPVRYKFLKKDFTEAGYIEDVMTRIALVNPNISIKLINSGKVVIQTSGNGDMKSIIYSIYGKDIAENILNVDYKYEDIRVTGVIGKPEIARSNRGNQLFFVNKRYIKDKVLSGAAEQAYKGLLSAGKYGFLVLNIEMNPKDVDVNVHPAKLEVRFGDENKIYKAIYHSIRDSLQKDDSNISETSEKNDEPPFKLGINNNVTTDKKDKETSEDNNSKTSDTTTAKLEANDILDNANNSSSINKINSTTEEGKTHEKISLTNEKIDEIINELKESIRSSGVTEVEEGLETKLKTTPTSEEQKEEEKKPYVAKNTTEKDIKKDNISQEKTNTNNLGYNFNSNIGKTDNINTKENVETVKTQFTNNYEKEEKTTVNTVKTSEEEKKDKDKEPTEEDKIESRFGVLFNKFGNKKHDKKESINTSEDDDIDDTKNFIAQIYNNKNDIKKEKAEDIDKMATKVVDTKQVNQKLEESNNYQEVSQNKINQNKTGQDKIGQSKTNQDKIDDKIDQNKTEQNKIDQDKISQEKIEQDDKDFEEMYEKTFGTKIREGSKVKEEEEKYTIQEKDLKTAENVSLFKQKGEHVPDYKFIGIAFEEYIIIEMKDELYIVDGHTAQERIIYEAIKENYYSEDNKDSQLMLLPDIINLSHKEMQIAKDNMDIFKNAGFELEEFGENTIKLTGVPTVCIDLDTKTLFIDILDEINTVARTSKQEVEEKFIETIAKKAAERAQVVRTKDEVDNLMRQLLVLQNPFTSPRSGAIAIRITKSDIEKKFSRR